jgi:hypothetical protein
MVKLGGKLPYGYIAFGFDACQNGLYPLLDFGHALHWPDTKLGKFLS